MTSTTPEPYDATADQQRRAMIQRAKELGLTPVEEPPYPTPPAHDIPAHEQGSPQLQALLVAAIENPDLEVIISPETERRLS